MNIIPFDIVCPQFSADIDYNDLFDLVKKNTKKGMVEFPFQTLKNSFLLQKTITTFGETVGLVSLVNLQDFEAGKILKHEHILKARAAEQWAILQKRKALVKPILLAHQPIEKLNTFYTKVIERKPFAVVNVEDESHQFWRIENEELSTVQDCFKTVQDVLIADGHHRLASLLELQNSYPSWDKNFMVVLVSSQSLIIKSFSRVVAIDHHASERFFEIVKNSSHCTISTLIELSDNVYDWAFCYKGALYACTWKNEVKENKSDFLNVQYLQKEVLDPLRIRNKDISYHEAKVPIAKLVEALKDNELALFLPPPSYSHIEKLARKGEVLPPKTTWFAPRIKNGLTIQQLPFLATNQHT